MFSVRLRQFASVGGTWALILSASVLFVAPVGAEPPKDDKKADDMAALLKARLAVAQKGYKATAECFGEFKRLGGGVTVLSVKPEECYTWAIRVLKAERALNVKPAEQIAALQAHLKRVTELEKRVKDLVPGILTVAEGLEAEWYRLEAEIWLAEEKAKK